jgi:hypothetical protein
MHFFEKSKNTCSLILCVEQESKGKSMKKFMQAAHCTEIFTVCSVERNPEVFFDASVKKKLLCTDTNYRKITFEISF